MPQKLKYRLSELINQLPRSVNATKDLQEKGIPERTLYRDKAIHLSSTQSISGDRLIIYAKYFSVSLDQLLTKEIKPSKSKIKTGLR